MCESVGPRGVRVVGSHRAYGIAIGTGARREIIRAADERCEGNLESLDLSDIGEHSASREKQVSGERTFFHTKNEEQTSFVHPTKIHLQMIFFSSFFPSFFFVTQARW